MAKKLSADVPKNSNDDALHACLAWLAEIEVEEMRLKARKAAKWRAFEAEGIDKDEAKEMHSLSKLDTDELQAKLATRARYTKAVFDFGPDGQGDFTQAMTKPPATTDRPLSDNEARLALARAFGDGYNSARAGGEVSGCPFKPGSEEYVKWRDGWTDGAADRKLLAKDAKVKPPKEEKTAQPRARKARGAKAPGGKKREPDAIDAAVAALDGPAVGNA